jgi:hypothetical protein
VVKDTVTKLIVDLGKACAEYQDRELRDLPCTSLQCDEMWGFCYAKQRNVPDEHQGTFGYGDVWTWVAVDADTKLVPTWLVGERNLSDCWTFMEDLKDRMRGRVQASKSQRMPRDLSRRDPTTQDEAARAPVARVWVERQRDARAQADAADLVQIELPRRLGARKRVHVHAILDLVHDRRRAARGLLENVAPARSQRSLGHPAHVRLKLPRHRRRLLRAADQLAACELSGVAAVVTRSRPSSRPPPGS